MTDQPGSGHPVEAPVTKDRAANPFPGPQAYRRDEQHYFFGRSDEIEELTSLVLSSSATLLYAPSGAGKSSLLQAGVAPYLEQRFDFVVLPIVRLGSTIGGTSQTDQDTNRFSRAVCEAISDATALGVPPTADIAAAAGTRRLDGRQRALLVLDQFEEVFSDPALWRERDEFFAALTTALDRNTWLRAIIVLRSDYLADLVPHERSLPGSLVVRYQLDRLTETQAAEAIAAAFAASGVFLAGEDLATLLDLLLDDEPNGPGSHRVRSQHVNTIQLQIVCRRLWEELRRYPGTDRASLLSDDSAFSLRRSMVLFVDEAIADVVTRRRHDEAAVRWWLSQRLITSTGRRAFVLMEEQQTAGLPNPVIEALAEVKLLQVEQRHGSRLVELTHDSMTEGVRASNEVWLRNRYRQRRLASALLFVLLACLIGAYPFLRVGDSESYLVELAGTIGDAEVRVPFAGGDEAVVVHVQVDDPAVSVTIRVVEKTARGDTQLGSGVVNAAQDGRLTTAIAVKTSPNLSYAVKLTAPSQVTYRLWVSSVVAIPPDQDTTTELAQRHVAVFAKAHRPELISVENGALTGVVGARILAGYNTKNWVVIESDRDQGITLYLEDPVTAGPPKSATVRRHVLPEPSPVTVGTPGTVAVDGAALVSFDVGELTAPAGIDVHCARPAEVWMPSDSATSDWSELSPVDTRQRVFPLNVDKGRHELLITDEEGRGSTNECQLTVQVYDQPMLGLFGPKDLTLAENRDSVAFALTLPADAVLTAAIPDVLSVQLLCRPAGTDIATIGARLLAYVPTGTSCTLWLSRTDDSDKAPVVLPLWVAQAATTGGR